MFDLPALRTLLQGLQTRQLDLVEVETGSASPMSSSLLFDYVATYMYEDDTPPAERRAQALSLDRDLLRELLGQRGAPRPARRATRSRRSSASCAATPRTPDELHDQLRRPRRPAGRASTTQALAAPLLAERRALLVRIAGEERLIAAEDAGRYRDALGVMPPGGLPDVFLEGGPDSLRQLVLRYAQGPRAVHDRARRTSGSAATSATSSSSSSATELLVRGELRPGRHRARVVRPDVLRRLRRASLAALRREVEPVEPAALARFLPSWHGSTGARRCARRSSRCRRWRCRWRCGRASCCRGACPATGPSSSTRSARAARSCGSAPGSTASPLYFREDAAGARPVAGRAAPEGEAHDAIRAALGRGALFWHDLLDETGLAADEALPALWDLVWAGEVTNDAWTPLRAGRRNGVPRPERRPRRFSRSRATAADRDAGPLVADRAPLRRRARAAGARRAPARAAGHRHARRRPRRGHPGRLRRRLRRAARARDARPLPARLLRRGARRRAVRARRRGRAAARAARGRRGARRRRARRRRPGAAVRRGAPVAEAGGRARRARRRAPTSCSLGGEAVLYVERGGRSLVPLRDPDEAWLRPALDALVAHVRGGGAKRLAVERFDGEPVDRERGDAAPRRGRLPRRAAPRRPAAVSLPRRSRRRATVGRAAGYSARGRPSRRSGPTSSTRSSTERRYCVLATTTRRGSPAGPPGRRSSVSATRSGSPPSPAAA